MKKLVVAAVALFALSACSHSATDYKDAAEKALKNDAETSLGQKLNDITCDTPSSKDIGTTFACTATGATDGTKYKFVATITKKDRVDVAQDTSGG